MAYSDCGYDGGDAAICTDLYFYGYMGVVSSLALSNLGAAIGTAMPIAGLTSLSRLILAHL